MDDGQGWMLSRSALRGTPGYYRWDRPLEKDAGRIGFRVVVEAESQDTITAENPVQKIWIGARALAELHLFSSATLSLVRPITYRLSR